METIETTIKKWKLNKSFLAEKMDMTNTTFNKKLDSSKDGEFSDKELIQLKMVLKEICGDLEEVIEIDFNDAMSVWVYVKYLTMNLKISINPMRYFTYTLL